MHVGVASLPNSSVDIRAVPLGWRRHSYGAFLCRARWALGRARRWAVVRRPNCMHAARTWIVVACATMTIVRMRARKLESEGLVDGKVHFGNVDNCDRLRKVCIEQVRITTQSSPTTPTTPLPQPSDFPRVHSRPNAIITGM